LKSTSWVIAVGLLAPGCDLATNGTHNVLVEMHQRAEDSADHKQAAALAEQAWAQVQSHEPGHAYSEDYAAGFEAGFTDFVYAGGSGEPPAVPPRRYWKSRYESPEGRQAAEDWFAGFRHGAGVAREGGYRKWLTLPSSLGCPAPVPAVPEVAALRPTPSTERDIPAAAVNKAPAGEDVVQTSSPSSGPASESVPHGKVLGVRVTPPTAKVLGVVTTPPTAKVLGVVATPQPRARVIAVSAGDGAGASW
jgi:hypothetical protein